MSPLGELYRREATRLRRRYPTLTVEQIDNLVAVSLARAFLDLDIAELAQAVIEGSLLLNGQIAIDSTKYAARLLKEALNVIAVE